MGKVWQERQRPRPRRLAGGLRPAAVAMLAGLQTKALVMDQLSWVGERLVLALVVLCFARHMAWKRASQRALPADEAAPPVAASDCWAVEPSRIEGLGLHLTADLAKGTSLGDVVRWSVSALPQPSVQRLGRHVNHSGHPNAILVSVRRGGQETLELVLLRDVEAGEEITSSYLLSPAFIALPYPWWR